MTNNKIYYVFPSSPIPLLTESILYYSFLVFSFVQLNIILLIDSHIDTLYLYLTPKCNT